MRVVLAAVNARYTHSSLALRYLKSYCGRQFPQIETVEFNINQSPRAMLADLALRRPDVVGFSCYIWNIEIILPLVRSLRKVCPETTILLGGPEVSFDGEHWLNGNESIDFLIAGEGEEALRRFLEEYERCGGRLSPESLAAIPGLVYRDGEGRVVANPGEPLDLAALPTLYEGDLTDLEDKIVYFETTRGCPFRCAYCLSSVMGPVRAFPMERVKGELARLARAGVQQVRFVDRTFNYDVRRAYELLEYMISLDTNTRFQLEVGGDLLTEPVLELLTTAPENRFQFEIGVQSTNPATLQAVSRRSDLGRLAESVRFLKERTKVIVLLDLIAGLPEEGFRRFGESFDFVYNLKPDRIHLGFLKLLRGSRLRAEAPQFGCLFTDEAPYEVLATKDLSFAELQRLKLIEDLVEKYYGPRFERSLEYLLRDGRSPFEFFDQFAAKWERAGYHWMEHSLLSRYRILLDFFGRDNPDLRPWLLFDFRSHERRQPVPPWLGGGRARVVPSELVRSGLLAELLPETAGLTPRQLERRIAVEELDFSEGTQTILFYYPLEGTRARTVRLA
ncbi:MAG TPA: DUF4080 domain-containing protein [Firmicutes bacterium]|jgi:anaerobic magnesium-protoporphyrin IX monomethyl ester cyclase|nr:DUF4080 domain-containing protein [Bacillota bacterium]